MAKFSAEFSGCGKEQVRHIAEQCARHAQPSDCFTLSGNLGAGKTFFASCFIPAFLGKEEKVSSPTFSISQHYSSMSSKAALWHFDLYRLEYVSEVEETGLMEALEQGVTLIEWAEIAQEWLPEETIDIIFAFEENSDYRALRIIGDAPWIQQLNPTS